MESRQQEQRKADMNRLPISSRARSARSSTWYRHRPASWKLGLHPKHDGGHRTEGRPSGGNGVERCIGERPFRRLGERRARLFGCRNQPSGRCIGTDCQRGRRSGAEDRRSHQPIVPGRSPYRRRRRSDQEHRRADQPARIECNHRGGPRRRGRPGVCRCRGRSEVAGRADREGDRRDQSANRRYPVSDRRLRRRDQEISSTIGRISEISATIASAVEEQGAATQEISRNVQRAAEGTSEGAANISDVQRGMSETGAASSQVLSAAKSLSKESDRLKREVGKFMDTVRAA